MKIILNCGHFIICMILTMSQEMLTNSTLYESNHDLFILVRFKLDQIVAVPRHFYFL